MAVVLYALLLFMLINASSMSEFHMLVAIVVMFNILELIMELLPNFPTDDTLINYLQISGRSVEPTWYDSRNFNL